MSESRKPPRRLRIPIEPIHVDELLAGAGMSGFLAVLDTPVSIPHLQELIHEVALPRPAPRSALDLRAASVVLKVEALTELIESTAENCCGMLRRN
jgi:hypothetical protein